MNNDSKGENVDSDPHAELSVGMNTDVVLNHSYDGIEEYDNPLPGWWKWLFVVTILFSFPYALYYHGTAEGRTLDDRYASAAAANARLQFAEIGELAGDETTLVKYANDPKWLRIGATVFKTNCVSCHGANGGGLVGPNLTDDHYKNVKTIADIYTVIEKGAAAGAMPAWQNRLEKNEQVLVSAYVASIRGSDPGGSPRGPEGREIPPWPEYVPAEESESE
ncbi:MAG: cbb3-type cytochrome c oxidase N-terminal domain-containing protein [Planctomycetota bacterium]